MADVEDSSSSATPDPNLARNVREKVAQGEHMELVDAAMAVAVDDEEAVKTVVKVALCCIQHERDMRPTGQACKMWWICSKAGSPLISGQRPVVHHLLLL
ncbi:unnamed protein product [Miscanthus lutarioriparius]|uniref:Uncharacterized protein n=1 Tax=Miscanthus lutarioriparius TaxID=422564 RepID=A0A811RH39_9POAL|nr:unnamed protein product [Miscanthus lutarioriparius]